MALAVSIIEAYTKPSPFAHHLRLGSPDNKIMYFTDSHSSTKTIYTYDFDAPSGSISNQRHFFQPENGNPDGLAIDANGDVWVALWDGWAVVQVSAQTGKVIRKIDFPVARPTCPCFGGEDFDELFVTSAAADENVKTLEGGLEGAVFRVKVGVKGLRKGKFKLAGV
jgi:sugar lactone lactonase YvrE